MKETLTKKLGPFPTYVWLALGVAAVAGFLLWKRSQSSSTAAGTTATNGSTLPATATTGYAMSGANGDNGWAGFNNTNNDPSTQGPTSTLGPVPGYSLLPTVGDLRAAAAAGLQVFEQSTPGVFIPTSYGNPTVLASSGFSKFASSSLISSTGAVPLYAATNGSVNAAGGTMTPGASAPVNTPVLNPGSPASAIAPSALQGAPSPSPLVTVAPRGVAVQG